MCDVQDFQTSEIQEVAQGDNSGTTESKQLSLVHPQQGTEEGNNSLETGVNNSKGQLGARQIMQHTHHMTTRSKSGTFKPKIPFVSTLSSTSESTKVQESLKCPKWRHAMQVEFDALTLNRT